MQKFDSVYKDTPLAIKILGTSRIYKFNAANSLRLKDVTNMIATKMRLNPLKSEFEYYPGWPSNPTPDIKVPITYTIKQCQLDKRGHLSIKQIKSVPIDDEDTMIVSQHNTRNVKIPGVNQNNDKDFWDTKFHDNYKNCDDLQNYLVTSKVNQPYNYDHDWLATKHLHKAFRTMVCERENLDMAPFEPILETTNSKRKFLESCDVAIYPNYSGGFPYKNYEEDPDVSENSKKLLRDIFYEIMNSQRIIEDVRQDLVDHKYQTFKCIFDSVNKKNRIEGLDIDDFLPIFKDCKINSKYHRLLFRNFDKNDDGFVCYDDFVQGIFGINKMFDSELFHQQKPTEFMNRPIRINLETTRNSVIGYMKKEDIYIDHFLVIKTKDKLPLRYMDAPYDQVDSHFDLVKEALSNSKYRFKSVAVDLGSVDGSENGFNKRRIDERELKHRLVFQGFDQTYRRANNFNVDHFRVIGMKEPLPDRDYKEATWSIVNTNFYKLKISLENNRWGIVKVEGGSVEGPGNMFATLKQDNRQLGERLVFKESIRKVPRHNAGDIKVHDFKKISSREYLPKGYREATFEIVHLNDHMFKHFVKETHTKIIRVESGSIEITPNHELLKKDQDLRDLEERLIFIGHNLVEESFENKMFKFNMVAMRIMNVCISHELRNIQELEKMKLALCNNDRRVDLYKLFGVIDKQNKGYIDVNEVLNFMRPMYTKIRDFPRFQKFFYKRFSTNTKYIISIHDFVKNLKPLSTLETKNIPILIDNKIAGPNFLKSSQQDFEIRNFKKDKEQLHKTSDSFYKSYQNSNNYYDSKYITNGGKFYDNNQDKNLERGELINGKKMSFTRSFSQTDFNYGKKENFNLTSDFYKTRYLKRSKTRNKIDDKFYSTGFDDKPYSRRKRSKPDWNEPNMRKTEKRYEKVLFDDHTYEDFLTERIIKHNKDSPSAKFYKDKNLLFSEEMAQKQGKLEQKWRRKTDKQKYIEKNKLQNLNVKTIAAEKLASGHWPGFKNIEKGRFEAYHHSGNLGWTGQVKIIDDFETSHYVDINNPYAVAQFKTIL